MTTITILRTRSTAPYALVDLRELRIVGYAHSKDERVRARARRLGAVILPIEGGKVSVTA
jgi:hypothetical protein